MAEERISRRAALSLPFVVWGVAQSASWRNEEIRRFSAPEANQAVAVDSGHFYAIGNYIVAKYDKKTGKRLAAWEGEKARPLIHLNSGIVRNGILHCAHSNYPGVPMVSSIEMWNTKTMRHSGSFSFGISAGSATWVDFRESKSYVTFGHYGNRAAEPNRDARWTSLVEFDAGWRRLQSWVYPDALIAKLGEYTISGGGFGPDGRMYCTGHDNPELYVLRFPEGGSTLVLEGSFGAPNHGQGIAWDPSDPWTLYSIDRARKEVIVTRVSPA